MGSGKWEVKLVHFGSEHASGEIDFDLKLVIEHNSEDGKWSLDIVAGKASMSHFDCRPDDETLCQEVLEKLRSRAYLDEASDLLFPFRLDSHRK